MRLVAAEAARYEKERVKNKSTYWLVFELMWRDFFRFYCAKHGAALWRPQGLVSRAGGVGWADAPPGSLVGELSKFEKEELRRWKEGLTGMPLVDANMRELSRTGYMSNRGRQNVASYLTLDLGVDWRAGADHFESLLIDYDPCSNVGNWLSVTGLTGGRVNRFNIVKQANDYDKDGRYVHHWLPELASVPAPQVHEVWKLGKKEQDKYGLRIGDDPSADYPLLPDLRHAKPLGDKKPQRPKGKPRPKFKKRRLGRGDSAATTSFATSFATAEDTCALPVAATLDEAAAAWLDEWQRRVDEWWLALPLASSATLRSCLPALSLHLASRLDLAYWLWRSERLLGGGGLGGGGAAAAPPPAAIAQTQEGCEWVADTPLQLPDFPSFSLKFELPSVLPIPRLVPDWRTVWLEPAGVSTLVTAATSGQATAGRRDRALNHPAAASAMSGAFAGFTLGVLSIFVLRRLRRK